MKSKNYLVIGSLFGSILLTGCKGAQVADTYNERARAIAARANLEVVQAAAEKYAKEHLFMYPTKIDDDFKACFPEGDPASKKPGIAPINPFTGSPEWPVMGKVTDLATARALTPELIGKGVIEYSSLDGGKNYAIRGGADTGKAMDAEDASHVGTLVLSRDSYKKLDAQPSLTQQQQQLQQRQLQLRKRAAADVPLYDSGE